MLHALHGTGVRNDDEIVLVLALNGEALGPEHARNDERHVPHANNLAHGIFAGKKLVSDGFADDSDLIGAAHVLLRESRTFYNRPLTDGKVLRRFTNDLGVPILISSRNLRAGAHLGTDGNHTGNFTLD